MSETKKFVPYMADYTKINVDDYPSIYNLCKTYDAAIAELERLRKVVPMSKSKMNEQRVIINDTMDLLKAVWTDNKISTEPLGCCGAAEDCINNGLKPFIYANYTPSEARGIEPAKQKTKKTDKDAEKTTGEDFKE